MSSAKAAPFPVETAREADEALSALLEVPLMTSRTGDERFAVEATDDGAALHVVLRGEADLSSVDDLRTALTSIVVDGTHRVELDVSDLDFIDVAVLRHLTLFALQLRDTGHDVRTRGARPVLVQLIKLFGVQEQLGLDAPDAPDAG